MLEGQNDPYVRETERFLQQLSLLTQAERIQRGHHLADFIRHCSFRGRECDLQKSEMLEKMQGRERQRNCFRDFTRTWDDHYGNCFTFAGGKLAEVQEKAKASNESGPLNGTCS